MGSRGISATGSKSVQLSNTKMSTIPQKFPRLVIFLYKYTIWLRILYVQKGKTIVQQQKTSFQYQRQHDKTYKMTCAPNENSDQPGHLPSLISLRCPHEESLGS